MKRQKEIKLKFNIEGYNQLRKELKEKDIRETRQFMEDIYGEELIEECYGTLQEQLERNK